MGGFVGGSFSGRRLVRTKFLSLLGVCLAGACASLPEKAPPGGPTPAERFGLTALEAPPKGTVDDEIARIQAGPEDPHTTLRLAYLYLRSHRPEAALTACYRLKFSGEAIEPEVEDTANLLIARAHLALGDAERSRHFARLASDQTRSPEIRAAALMLQKGGPAPRTDARKVKRPAPEPEPAAPVGLLARERWGAAQPHRDQMVPMGPIRRVTVHHTGFHVDATDVGGSARVMRSIQRTHMESDHFADIGYHFVIDRTGRVWEGRSLSQQGAHAGDDASNRGNVGVCLMGNFEPNDQQPSDVQMTALRRLVERILVDEGLGASSLVTHQEVRPARMGRTECPGQVLQTLVERMRSQLRSRFTALGK